MPVRLWLEVRFFFFIVEWWNGLGCPRSLADMPSRLEGADKRQINDNGLTTRLQARVSFIESPYGGSNPSPTAKEDKMCSNLKEASSYYTL